MNEWMVHTPLQVWSPSTYPFLIYSVLTADTLRYTVTLTFDPLILNVCSVSTVTWSDYVSYFSKIKQSLAKSWRFEDWKVWIPPPPQLRFHDEWNSITVRPLQVHIAPTYIILATMICLLLSDSDSMVENVWPSAILDLTGSWFSKFRIASTRQISTQCAVASVMI